MKSRGPWRLFLLGLLTWSLTAAVGGAAEAPPTLDLKEALRLAWKANPTMQISRLQSLIAGEEVVRARSGLLAQIKSEVSQTIYDNQIKQNSGGRHPRRSRNVGTLVLPQTNRNFWSSQTTLTR